MNQNNNKIAIISSTFPPLGGTGVAIAHYHLYHMLKDRKYQVKVFTFSDNKKDLTSNTDDIIRNGTPGWLSKIINISSQAYFKFHNYSENSYQFADITETCFGALKINWELYKYNPDLVILPDHGCPALYIHKNKRCRFILISHHNPLRFINNPLLNLHNISDAKLASRIERYTLNKIDQVVCPSSYMKDVFKKVHHYLKPIKVIPNIIDQDIISQPKKIDLHKKLLLPKKAPLIYIPSAGSLFKGSDYVFEIIRRVTGNTKQPIGFYLSGNINPKLAYQLKYLPSYAKVSTPGNVDYQTNLSYIKDCSFGISPTLIESFGMAILEANFCGLPMVVFDAGGTGEVVKNGQNGYLIPYLDFENLISKSMLLLDNKILNKMKVSTKEYINLKFKGQKILDKYLQLIN